MVLFENPRDVSQFASLARQMYPNRSAFAVEGYKDATREPYSYLLVDLRGEQDEELRLRTNIFPGETSTSTCRRNNNNNNNVSAHEEVPANTEENTDDGRQGKAGVRSQVRQTVSRLHERVR